LYTSAGSPVTSGWSSGDYVELTRTLTVSGTYTLWVGDNGGTDTADYVLHLQRLNGPANARSIAYGQIVTGTIGFQAEMDVYTFTASAGDVILAGLSDNGIFFDPRFGCTPLRAVWSRPVGRLAITWNSPEP